MAPVRRRFAFATGLTLAALLASASFSCNSSSQAGLASTCSINSDCSSPLACAFAKCHSACRESRDCSSGQRCVKVGASSVCQLPAESTCAGSTGACPSGQVCGGDQQCRPQCSASVACAMGDYCAAIGTSSLCYSTSNPADELALIGAGILAPDGGPIGDGSASQGDANGRSLDAEADGTPADGAMTTAGDGGDATVSPGTDGAGDANAVNACPTPQTTFGNTAQGDMNASFTSGVGVRNASSLLIFSAYSGPAPSGFGDGGSGDGGSVNIVYVQAFDPGTGHSMGPAAPFFQVVDGPQFSVYDISIAPTGEIALLYGAGKSPLGLNNVVFASFLAASTDAGGVAGVQVQQTVKVESAEITNSPHATWSAASHAFVFSWQFYDKINRVWHSRTKKFLPSGRPAGGDTNVVPFPCSGTDGLYPFVAYSNRRNQGHVGTSGNLFAVASWCSANPGPVLTVLDALQGTQIGDPIQLSPATDQWVTIGGTSTGFVTLFNHNSSVYEVFVPTTGDGGVVGGPTDADADGGDAGGFAGFSFTSSASNAHAISDDTGGVGGVGAVLLEANGASFLYVKPDGLTHIETGGVLSSASGTLAAISNYRGSFAISLYDSATQSTQVAASGCQ